MNPSIVVFDIGAVLLDWKPHLAWLDELGSVEAVEDFFERSDFFAKNQRGDNGESFFDMAGEISDPEMAKLLPLYVTNFGRTVQDEIPGTWDIVDRLIGRGVPLHAITNWAAETWPHGLSVHPRLGEIFGVTVVSGQEKVMKPNPKIYQTLLRRANVDASNCVFIDDSLKNVDGAKAVGMDAIHFTGAGALETALVARGLL